MFHVKHRRQVPQIIVASGAHDFAGFFRKTRKWRLCRERHLNGTRAATEPPCLIMPTSNRS
ncbi:hypothetical protein SAMN05216414_1075 [Nitrosovibrio sp. Nv17]|nr:hypothetical protein SAMN05216414_1075 [Nitrosovibrio sp. Nv17]